MNYMLISDQYIDINMDMLITSQQGPTAKTAFTLGRSEARIVGVWLSFSLRCSTSSSHVLWPESGCPPPLFLWSLRRAKKTEIAPQIGPFSGSQGSGSPTFARSRLLFGVRLGPKQVRLEPQGNQIWN